jgi:hypothetical protein
MRGKIRNAVGIEAIATVGIGGAGWYDDARYQIRTVCELGGWDTPLFTGVLAVTSPRCTVRRNIRITLHRLVNGVVPKGTMGAIARAADNWIDRRVISGPKVSAFYTALMGCDDGIVWDTHMINAFGIELTRFNGSARGECERILRIVAKRLNLTPLQAQAAVWCGWRSILGYNYSGFPVIDEYRAFVDNAALADSDD